MFFKRTGTGVYEYRRTVVVVLRNTFTRTILVANEIIGYTYLPTYHRYTPTDSEKSRYIRIGNGNVNNSKQRRTRE